LEVECKRADDLFLNYKPTYLKFDIEGAELAALKGWEKVIRTYYPKLAVSLSFTEDLWQICLYLVTTFHVTVFLSGLITMMDLNLFYMQYPINEIIQLYFPDLKR
jgi:hypothetical protein